MIRIISGKYGGRFICPPKGKKTRPTTNRVKESVFSSICSAYSKDLKLDGAYVLDMFAGTGSLGIEAISRGASKCVFCDNDNEALMLVKNNCEILNLDKSTYEIIKADSLNTCLLKDLMKHIKFNLIFADPPYSIPSLQLKKAIKGLIDCDFVRDEVLFYYEHAIDTDVTCFCNEFETIYDNSFGEIGCNIFKIKCCQ